MKMQEFFDSKFADALADSGFKVAPAIAGFFGGIVSAWMENSDKKWWHKLANICAGSVAAGYASELIAHIVHLPVSYAGGIGFAVGLFGMKIADKIIDFIIDHDLKQILDVVFPIRKFFKNNNKK